MSELIPKLFCPLLSTGSKKAYCDEKCMWYIHNDNCSGVTCAVPLSLMNGGEILTALEKQAEK